MAPTFAGTIAVDPASCQTAIAGHDWPTMITETIESIADETRALAGVAGAVDAYDLCAWKKLRVVLGPPGCRTMLVGDYIIVNPDDPPERRRFGACHELSHRLLRERGILDTEWRVNWLASALLHPRDWFMAQLAAHGWDLAALRVVCPYSSHEAIARRIVNTRSAVLWVCDRDAAGRRTSQRICSRGVPVRLAGRRPTPIEWSAVKEAAATKREHSIGFLRALPIERGAALRVICLANARELARTVGA